MRGALFAVLAMCACNARVAQDAQDPPSGPEPAANATTWHVGWTRTIPWAGVGEPMATRDAGFFVPMFRDWHAEPFAIDDIVLDCPPTKWALVKFDRDRVARSQWCLPWYGAQTTSIASDDRVFVTHTLGAGSPAGPLLIEQLGHDGVPRLHATIGDTGPQHDPEGRTVDPSIAPLRTATYGRWLLLAGTFLGHQHVGDFAGVSYSGGGIWLARIDEDGTVERARFFADVGHLYGAEFDEQGNAYLVGDLESGHDFEGRTLTPKPLYGGFVASFDRELQLRWARYSSEASGGRVTLTEQGPAVLTKGLGALDASTADVLGGEHAVVQLDRDGALVWRHHLEDRLWESFGMFIDTPWGLSMAARGASEDRLGVDVDRGGAAAPPTLSPLLASRRLVFAYSRPLRGSRLITYHYDGTNDPSDFTLDGVSMHVDDYVPTAAFIELVRR